MASRALGFSGLMGSWGLGHLGTRALGFFGTQALGLSGLMGSCELRPRQFTRSHAQLLTLECKQNRMNVDYDIDKHTFLPASTRSVPPGIHFALLLLLLLLLGRPLIKLGTISADS
jgi:hypothetical protein